MTNQSDKNAQMAFPDDMLKPGEETTETQATPNWWLWVERVLIGVLAISWVAKIFLWATPINVLYRIGLSKNYIIAETAISMLLGGALVVLISYQRHRFSSPKMFWGTAIAAGGLATIQLIVMLIIGLATQYFGFGS